MGVISFTKGNDTFNTTTIIHYCTSHISASLLIRRSEKGISGNNIPNVHQYTRRIFKEIFCKLDV